MSIFHKIVKDTSKQAGTLFGNAASENARKATSSTVKGMDLFRQVAEKKRMLLLIKLRAIYLNILRQQSLIRVQLDKAVH